MNNKKIINRKIRADFISKFIIFILAFSAVVALILMFTFILKSAIPAIAHYGFFQIYFKANFNPAAAKFGIWGPLTITLWTSVLATAISWWISVRLAIFINFRLKYGKKVSQLIVQLLAGIPSIIFGLFAAKALGAVFNKVFGIPQQSIFTAIIMLSFMIIPTMTSLVLNQLKHLSNISLSRAMSLGNTKTYSIYKVIKKEIHAGIIVAAIVSFGRAIGETMAISLVLSGGLSSPFAKGFFGLFTQSWATLGANIAYWMGSDASTPYLKDALFAAGLSLFILIMIINIMVMNISRRKLFANTKKFQFLYKKNSKKTSEIMNIYYLTIFILFYPFRLIKYLFIIIFDSFKKAWELIKYLISNMVTRIILPKKNIDQSYSNYFCSIASHPLQKVSDTFKIILEWICVIFVGGFIFWIITDIFVKGSNNFEFKQVFTLKKDTLGNSLMNTILLIEITIVIALPLSLATAIYLSEFARKSSKSSKIIKFFLDSLSGTPSILFGMFGLIFFLQTLHIANGNFWKVGSVWAGGLTMVLVILPTFTRSIEQTFIRVPDTLREGAYSLGASKWETIRKIVIPSAFSGIFTGVILSIGRILSETAPVFLTMGLVSSNNFNPGLPGQTLTSRILYYIIYSPETPDEATNKAYQAALLTFVLVLFITIIITFGKDIKEFIKKCYYMLPFYKQKTKTSILNEKVIIQKKGIKTYGN